MNQALVTISIYLFQTYGTMEMIMIFTITIQEVVFPKVLHELVLTMGDKEAALFALVEYADLFQKVTDLI